ncbi:MAG TPA: tetratricopeptide repeat protein, partial [Candidatus Binataceae bacterium]|nr:tetratricopeptide repeat protein [Candidatus Binataceae bacterium]
EMIDLNPLIAQWSFLWKSFGHDLWWFRPNGKFPKSNYYRPLQDLWLGGNYHLFGFDPVGWHVSIVLVHLIAVYTLYHIGCSLTRRRWGACVGATLFGVLPIGVQAAAWPCAIPFPMVAAFYLGAMWFFIERRRAPLKYLGISLALFAGALLSHEEGVMLPGLLMAYVFLLEDAPAAAPAASGRGAQIRTLAARAIDAIWKTTPYLVLAAIYLALRIAVLGFINNKSPDNNATFAQVLMSIPSALAHYAALMVIPWMAGPAHAFTFADSVTSPIFYLPVAVLGVLGVAVVLMLRTTARWRLYTFLILWTLFEIAPVMNLGGLVRVMLIQDRYAYMAAFAVALLAGDITAGYAERGGEARNLATAVAVTVIAVYGVGAWTVEGYYHDEYTLFTKCIQEDPSSTLCRGRLGMLLENQHDFKGAELQFRADVALNPDDGVDLYNLGRLHAAEGHYIEADNEMARALKLLGSQVPPAFELELAQIADRAGDSAGAEAAFKIAEADPNTADAAQLMRARLLAQHHDYRGAQKLLAALAAKNPGSVQVHGALGAVMELQGDHQGAIDQYQLALALAPANPLLHTVMAQSLHAEGRDGEALAECKQALALQPANAAARALETKLEAAGASPNKLLR